MTTFDMGALKEFVKGDPLGMACQGDSTVLLSFSHSNLKQTRFMEIRLDLHMTIERVKDKLTTHVGTAGGSMRLILKDDDGNKVAVMDDNSKKLGFYSPQSGWSIHIVDLDESSLSKNGGLEDVNQVTKYMMSDEDYDTRDNTYRQHKKKMVAQDPTWTLEKEMAKRNPMMKARLEEKENRKPTDTTGEEEAKGVNVGDRCEVMPGGRRGEVKFVGKVPEIAAGFWVGVQFDEPVGKNDGSVKGNRYFECPEGFGGIVRPNLVNVGDFPEDDPLAMSDEDEI